MVYMSTSILLTCHQLTISGWSKTVSRLHMLIYFGFPPRKRTFRTWIQTRPLSSFLEENILMLHSLDDQRLRPLIAYAQLFGAPPIKCAYRILGRKLTPITLSGWSKDFASHLHKLICLGFLQSNVHIEHTQQSISWRKTNSCYAIWMIKDFVSRLHKAHLFRVLPIIMCI